MGRYRTGERERERERKRERERERESIPSMNMVARASETGRSSGSISFISID